MTQRTITAYASFTLTFEADIDESLSPDQRAEMAQVRAKLVAKDLCRQRWPAGLIVKYDHLSPCIDVKDTP